MESCGVVGGESRKRGRVKDGADGDGDEQAAKRLPLAPWAPPHQNPPHPASRIYRVSRASGGKDRHSKVYTAKGIRDRRVRLSVATAIQFYDLQDRLGYDQPSKAIEWLIKAAADAIDKLPELHNNFPSHPASAAPAAAAANDNGNKDKAEREEAAGDHGSGCSSTSETSKGSVLSLSRSESRVKARERARERSAAKDPAAAGDDTARPAPTSSFTELLTGMSAAAADHKQHQQPPPTSSWTADYIGFADQPPRKPSSTLPQAFASAAPHLAGGNNISPPAQQQLFGLSAAGVVTVASQPHTEMPTQHFSFLQHEQQQQDHQHHFMSAVHAPPAGDYNLNFSMSSGGGGLVMGVNSRGTLQSNSPQISSAHHHQQLQRLTSAPLEAAAPNNIPFLFTPASAPITADTQFAAAFQLWNGFHHHAADMKEKGKN